MPDSLGRHRRRHAGGAEGRDDDALTEYAGPLLPTLYDEWTTADRERLREISRDLITIIGGAAVMLVWAGAIEAFLSQYHQPVLPYGLKIAFGCCELTALTFFLTWAGRE